MVSLDRTGSFERLPIKVVATKIVSVQECYSYYIDEEDVSHYKKYIHKKWLSNKRRKKNKKKVKPENYRERIYAALYFQTMNKLVRHTDEIQIDYDFEGWRQDLVKGYLKKLFSKVYGGTSISDPPIEFITDHCLRGEHIKDAHGKTQDAKHKQLREMQHCPSLEKLLDYLE